MSQGPNADRPTTGCSAGLMFLSALTMLVLCCAIPQAVLLDFVFFYPLKGVKDLDESKRAEIQQIVVREIAWLVWPLIFVCVCWLLWAFSVWNNRQPSSERSQEEEVGPSVPPSPAPKESSPHIRPADTELKDHL